MAEQEDEFVLLEEFSAEHGKIIVLDNDEYSIWAFVLDAQTQEIEIDVFVCSLSQPFEDEEEVEQMIENGYSPAITTFFASDSAVKPNALKSEFSVKWIEDGWLELFMDDQLVVMIDLDQEEAFTKAVCEDGPYGLVFRDELRE